MPEVLSLLPAIDTALGNATPNRLEDKKKGEAALTRQKTGIKLDKVIFINGSLF